MPMAREAIAQIPLSCASLTVINCDSVSADLSVR